MEIKGGDNFYHNNSHTPIIVTYELRCDPTGDPLEVAILHKGSKRHACRILPGRTEEHSFSIPSGGTLHCELGAGTGISKGVTLAALSSDFLRQLDSQGQRLERISKERLPDRRKLFFAAYLIGIIWVNLYICRQVFFLEYTGKTNSMHGVWIAMARLGGGHWLTPSWWPYWYNGMPFEYTYAPMVPGLSAAIAWLFGFTAAHGFQVVCGLVYCFGPVALFLMARQLTHRPGWSFIAAVVYSLSSSTELLMPDTNFSLAHVRNPRRLYISFVWDELPHYFSLALVCVAILFLARALDDRRVRSHVWAGLFVALALLSSVFGGTSLVLFAGCLLVTFNTQAWKKNLVGVVLCGVFGYLAMCPYLPPSLILAIRSNGALFAHMSFTRTSLWTLLGVLGGGTILWFASRMWRPWYLRFFFLLTYLTLAIPFLYERWGLHFFPQSSRYKVELELALVLMIVFGAAVLVDRLPKGVRVGLALVLLWPAYRQVLSHRQYSKADFHAVDMTKSIEYQVGKWTEANLPGWRVLAPGSIWAWLNTFTRVPQFRGGSFPTAPNVVQVHADSELPGDPAKTAIPLIWYKAYGVDAIVEDGPDSPQFWGPHENGHQFDGVLPIVWNQRDTRICAIPRPRTLAHVISSADVVSQAPSAMNDTAQLERYVSAVESADVSAATFQWMGDSRARIHARILENQVLSVQVTYHPGWKAIASGRTVCISKDGLGQMLLRPQQAGDYAIDLIYDGGWESTVCRALSALVLLAAAIAAVAKG